MAILVTGGAGYIGSHTVHQLLEQGYRVTVMDNLSSGHRWTLQGEVELVEADIGDPTAVAATLSRGHFDTVIHFAAHIKVAESVTDPLKYYQNNVANTISFMQQCQKHKVDKFIFSSTAAVYGQSTKPTVDEFQPTTPLNPYGHSKLMCEQILRDLCAIPPQSPSDQSMRSIILRYFNVAGAHHRGHLGQLIKDPSHLIGVACAAASGERTDVPVFGTDYSTSDGTCIRDYIHVEDLADAHIRALEYLQRGGASDLFNVGYGTGHSVLQVLDSMRRVTGIEFPSTTNPPRPGDAPQVVADARRIRTMLGWKPRYQDLDRICASAYSWHTQGRVQHLRRQTLTPTAS